MRIITDMFACANENVPEWNTISISGYHMREAGSTAVQEVAFTLANGMAYVAGCHRCRARRRPVRAAAFVLLQRAQQFPGRSREIPRRAPHVGPHHARALRRQEPQVVDAALPHPNRGLHAHRAATGKQHRPHRDTGHGSRSGRNAVAAHQFFDEALALPTEQSARIALRTQQIIAYESGAPQTIDPLAGSYYVESLTNEIESRAIVYLEKIDAMGGMLKAIERGFVQQEIQNAAYEYQRAVDHKEAYVVGVNSFTIDQEHEVPLQHIDESLERKQIDRLHALRAKRDQAKWAAAVKQVEDTAKGTGNLMPVIVEAIEANATVGEISDAMRHVYGEYHETVVI